MLLLLLCVLTNTITLPPNTRCPSVCFKQTVCSQAGLPSVSLYGGPLSVKPSTSWICERRRGSGEVFSPYNSADYHSVNAPIPDLFGDGTRGPFSTPVSRDSPRSNNRNILHTYTVNLSYVTFETKSVVARTPL